MTSQESDQDDQIHIPAVTSHSNFTVSELEKSPFARASIRRPVVFVGLSHEVTIHLYPP